MAFDPLLIQAGELRHQISIQAPSQTRDAAGEIGASYTTVLTTWAKIEDSSSLTFKYSFQGNTLAANATYAITIRYPYGEFEIKPNYIIQYGDLTFQIQAINDIDMRHFKLVLACVGIDINSA